MNFLQVLVPVVLTGYIGFLSPCYSSDETGNDKQNGTKGSEDRDAAVLMEYLKSKRPVGVLEHGGNLTISGDLRGEWDNLHARNHHHQMLRGWDSRKKTKEKKEPPLKKGLETDPPKGKNEFAVEANLLFDYRAERGWGTIQLRFDNAAGISDTDKDNLVKHKDGIKKDSLKHKSKRIMFGSGTRDKIALRQCMAGYNLWQGDIARFDIEVGRKKMYGIFDSKIEFDSYFDGLLLRYMNSFPGILDFVFKGGAFVIDSVANHYGYVGETSFFNLYDSGVDFKYSLIDWQKRGRNRWGRFNAKGDRFLVSQFLLYYNLPDFLGQKTAFYGAYLVNSLAKPNHWSRHKRENEAFYFGLRMNEIRKKGDWSFDVWYFWIQPQAIPERDVQDPGRDNPREGSWYLRRSGGFANCRGCRFECFYALTDNWTIHPTFDFGIKQVAKSIGGLHRSSGAMIEVVFAF